MTGKHSTKSALRCYYSDAEKSRGRADEERQDVIISHGPSCSPLRQQESTPSPSPSGAWWNLNDCVLKNKTHSALLQICSDIHLSWKASAVWTHHSGSTDKHTPEQLLCFIPMETGLKQDELTHCLFMSSHLVFSRFRLHLQGSRQRDCPFTYRANLGPTSSLKVFWFCMGFWRVFIAAALQLTRIPW